jgi:MoxR-like ATPase
LSILSDLRIFGFSQAQENCVLSCLLVGEPLLFIGGPGLAKTEVVESIGSALREDSKRLFPNNPSNWFKYQIYDASKLNFEDLIGYPSPTALKANPPRVEFVETQSTIWGKDMIAFDEINRCVEERQSNLFEILRSRKLNGIPTGNKFIFSTMNPFGDAGTVTMSDALVDRNLFYLRIDDFANMSTTERRKVINRVGKVDGIGSRHWGNTKEELDTDDNCDEQGKVHINELLANVGQRIRLLMQNASKLLSELKDSHGNAITEVINKVIDAMNKEFASEAESLKNEVKISGRRASLMLRGILALRVLEISNRNEDEVLGDITSTIINGMKLSLPIGISGKLDDTNVARANKVIENTVRATWHLIKQNKDTVNVDKVSEALNTNNPIKILDCLLTVDLNNITKDKIFSLLLDDNKYKDPKTNIVNTYIKNSMRVLLHTLNTELPGFIPTHVNLSVTPQEIEDVTKPMRIPLLGPISDFTDIINSYIKSSSESPLLSFGSKLAIHYYTDNCPTEESAIKAILDMKNVIKSIKAKMEAITKAKNETDTTENKTEPVK